MSIWYIPIAIALAVLICQVLFVFTDYDDGIDIALDEGHEIPTTTHSDPDRLSAESRIQSGRR